MRTAAKGNPLELLGVPYVLGAADPACGFDCWSLITYVRRVHYHRPTPLMPEDFADACASGLWRRILWPHEAAVVGLSRSHRLPLHHVGVVVPGGVLHAWNGPYGGTGSVVLTPWDRLDQYFAQIEVYECLD